LSIDGDTVRLVIWPKLCWQVAQLSQRDHATAVRQFWPKMEEDILQLMSCLQLLWCNRPPKQSISVKKRKITAITPFNVIQGHQCQ